ncbi:MAG: RagB/SusD family nutrient uptake outer membrane protein, partial [Rikenellaceae bacterium]
MKKIIYSLLGLVMVSSCSLDTTPTDRYLESTFWSNDAQVDAGLTACYQTLRDTYLYGGTATALFNDVVTPNQYMYDNTYGFGVIGQGSHTVTNSEVIRERWGSCYKGIGRCNSFLAQIAKYEMKDAAKKLRIAQAKFLRALYYSILTDYYGAAPIILDAPDPATQSKLPRDPKAKIVEQIVKDLNEASVDLPVSYSSSNDKGRATKGAAYALKARVYLYNSMWGEAAKAAGDVIALNKYAVIDDYRSIFKRDNEGNKEVIFDVQSLNPDFTTNFDLITRQYLTHAPLLDLCKAYENAD